MKENYKKLAYEWFCKADDDLLFAKAGWKETKITSDACFLCQQAIEKYLKGFLIFYKIKPERIHDLRKLLSECVKINDNLKQFEEECKILNDYYVSSRYPGGEIFSFKKEQAKEALESAEEIMEFIKKIIF